MTTITTVIDPPLPTDTPSVFNTKAFEAWVDINTWATQANTVSGEVNTNAATATTKAAESLASSISASSSAGTATTKAGEALTSANTATTQAGLAETARIAAEAALDAFDDKYLGSKTSDPTVDNDGNPLQEGSFYINSISGYIRVYTSGTWVQGIAGVAGVSSFNGLVGAVTGVSSVNGISGPIVSPTQAEAEAGTDNVKPMSALRTAQAIATQAISTALLRVVVFTSSGTWTKGANTKKIKVRLVGGGGGSQGCGTSTDQRCGGHGGGYSEKVIDVSAITSEAVTVGAGGAAGSSGSGNDAGSGGTSSFGVHLSATGGLGGRSNQNLGGMGVGGDVNASGFSGSGDQGSGFGPPGYGGGSLLGGGPVALYNSAGIPGRSYGSGAAPAYSAGTARAGAIGAAGVVIVEEYA